MSRSCAFHHNSWLIETVVIRKTVHARSQCNCHSGPRFMPGFSIQLQWCSSLCPVVLHILLIAWRSANEHKSSHQEAAQRFHSKATAPVPVFQSYPTLCNCQERVHCCVSDQGVMTLTQHTNYKCTVVVLTHQKQAVGVAGAGQVEAAAAGGNMAAQSSALGAALLALEAAAPPHLRGQPFQPPICLMHLPCHTS